MKNTLLLIPLAMLGLASCSDDVSTSVNLGDAIEFRPAMGSFTRASETTNANLNDMNVTAFLGDTKFFENVNFAKGNDGFYTSQHNYLWPADNSQLTFYAYSSDIDNLNGTLTWDATSKKLENATIPDEIADQIDFITASATGTKDNNETAGVPLTFNHQLSQIELQAKSDTQDYTVEVSAIRIGRAEYMGTFDFTTSEWTLDEWHDKAVYDSSLSSPVTLSATPVSIMGDSGNAMLLPQKLTPWSPKGDPDNAARGSYLSVLIKITTPEGVVLYPYPSDTKLDSNGQKREYAWASIPIDTKWEAGKKYIYTLDFTHGGGNVDPDDPTPGKEVLGGPIKYTVNVVDWVNTPTDISMEAITKIY